MPSEIVALAGLLAGRPVIVEIRWDPRRAIVAFLGAADMEANAAAIQVIFDALAAYRPTEGDAIDATRVIRSSLHGFVTLNAAGTFELPDLDRSFRRLTASLQQSFALRKAVTI